MHSQKHSDNRIRFGRTHDIPRKSSTRGDLFQRIASSTGDSHTIINNQISYSIVRAIEADSESQAAVSDSDKMKYCKNPRYIWRGDRKHSRGSFGNVIRFYDCLLMKYVLFKSANESTTNKKDVRSISKQFECRRGIAHEISVYSKLKKKSFEWISDITEVKCERNIGSQSEVLEGFLVDEFKEDFTFFLDNCKGFMCINWIELFYSLLKLLQCGVTHCDLKPIHIRFVTKPLNPGIDFSSIRFIDFGVACVDLESCWFIPGTVYAAPENVKTKKKDFWTAMVLFLVYFDHMKLDLKVSNDRKTSSISELMRERNFKKLLINEKAIDEHLQSLIQRDSDKEALGFLQNKFIRKWMTSFTSTTTSTSRAPDPNCEVLNVSDEQIYKSFVSHCMSVHLNRDVTLDLKTVGKLIFLLGAGKEKEELLLSIIGYMMKSKRRIWNIREIKNQKGNTIRRCVSQIPNYYLFYMLRFLSSFPDVEIEEARRDKLKIKLPESKANKNQKRKRRLDVTLVQTAAEGLLDLQSQASKKNKVVLAKVIK